MKQAVPLRSIVKSVLVAGLFYGGLLWLLVCVRLRRRVAVLTYHRILPLSKQRQSFSAPGIVVTPETFDRHMRFLRRHFNPIDVNTFTQLILSGAPLRPRTCLVTFDDGWRDNLEFALPILRRHQVPAVLFVATDYIGTGICFWQESLSRQLYEARHQPDAGRLFADFGLVAAVDASPEDARASIRNFVDDLKTGPSEAVDRIVGLLKAVCPGAIDPELDQFLSWEELTELTSDGWFTVACHGRSHTPMTRLTRDDIRAELTASRQVILSHLGTTTIALAYPNGDANSDVAAMVQEEGFAIAFTTRRGLVTAGDDPLLLPRINIHESAARSHAAFLYNLLGIP